MKIDTANWKEFNVSRTSKQPGLLDIEQCKCGCAGDLIDGNEICYIGAKKNDNGVMKRVKLDEELISHGNGIMIICDGQGSVGYSNYMKDDFIGSTTTSIGYDEEINQIRAMFIVTCLDLDRYKYSYGRKYRPSMNSAVIKLPVQRNSDGIIIKDKSKKYSKEGYIPDWQFMEQYIKSLHHKPLTTKNRHAKVAELDTTQWKEFALNRVFTLKGGFYNKKPEHSQGGNIPFLGSTENDNGVTEYYSIEDIKQWNKTGEEDFTLNKKLYKGNCIAVTVNGSVCNAFYQKDEFTCSHDITAFYLNGYVLNPLLGMFLCTVIMKDKYRWSYGRKPHDVKKFGKSIIKLPIQHNTDGSPVIDKIHQYSDKGYIPDWQFMEDYIKSLPYGDRL